MSTPKPVVNAIYPDLLKVGEHTLRPLTLSSYLLLERIDSPFVRSPDQSKVAAPPDTKDLMLALFVLTRTREELQASYEGFDRKSFETEAWQFGDAVPVDQFASLMPALAAIFSKSTETIIGAGASELETGDDAEKKKKPARLKNSTAAAARTTDSAGV